jgi:hypothetical protein
VNSNAVPNDVQQDIFEFRVAVVTVGAPAARAQVNLHITGTWYGIANLNDRTAKIRSAFNADKTGMQNPDESAIGRLEAVALQPLVAPDGLEQAFRRRSIFIVQDLRRAQTRAPVGVKIFSRRRHCGLLLRPRLSKVKPAHIILNAADGGFFAGLEGKVFCGGIFVGRNPEFPAKLHPTFR